jgi:hypothetical protein
MVCEHVIICVDSAPTEEVANTNLQFSTLVSNEPRRQKRRTTVQPLAALLSLPYLVVATPCHTEPCLAKPFRGGDRIIPQELSRCMNQNQKTDPGYRLFQ